LVNKRRVLHNEVIFNSDAQVAGIQSQIVHKAKGVVHILIWSIPKGHWCYLSIATNLLARRKIQFDLKLVVMS
jgi:hypothetical protein